MAQTPTTGKWMTRAAVTAPILLPLAALAGCTAPAPTAAPAPTPSGSGTGTGTGTASAAAAATAAAAQPIATAPRVLTPPPRDANELARLTFDADDSTVATSATITTPALSGYAVSFACSSAAPHVSVSYSLAVDDSAGVETAAVPCGARRGRDASATVLPEGTTLTLTMHGDFAQITSAFVVLSRE